MRTRHLPTHPRVRRRAPKQPPGDSLGNLLLIVVVIAAWTLIGWWRQGEEPPRDGVNASRADLIHSLVRDGHGAAADAAATDVRLPPPWFPRGSTAITRMVLAADHGSATAQTAGQAATQIAAIER